MGLTALVLGGGGMLGAVEVGHEIDEWISAQTPRHDLADTTPST